jgi:hypothetical protein
VIDAGTVGVVVTVVIFLAGVIYNAGKTSARIDEMEKGQKRLDLHVDAIFNSIRSIELTMRQGPH